MVNTKLLKIFLNLTQTIHFDIQCTGFNASGDLFDFKSLCHAFSTGDVKMIERLLSKMVKLKTNLKQNDERILFECACIGRCTEFVEFLSTIIQLERHQIAFVK